MTHQVPANCKICKKPVVLEIDNDCPDEWSKKLIPMATCDKCYDFYSGKRDIGERIESILCQLNYHKLFSKGRSKPVLSPEQEQELRIKLQKLCHAYMCHIAEYHGYTWALPVDELMGFLTNGRACDTRKILSVSARMFIEKFDRENINANIPN